MNIEIEVDDNRIADLICSALEGGSSYWCQIAGYVKPAKEHLFARNMNTAPADGKAVSTTVYRHVQYPMSRGGAVLLRDLEYEEGYNERVETEYRMEVDLTSTDKPDVYRLDVAAVRRGLNLLVGDKRYAQHYGDWMSEQDDATTGDVFLQLCLFGNIIYG